MSPVEFSIVIPAKNEAQGLRKFLPELRSRYAEAEIIVVNDGSSDDTVEVCVENNVKLVNHQYSRGNGASIKSGARTATKSLIVFMDGDGQHKPEDVQRLLDKLLEGYDMVVGARDTGSQASMGRLLANGFYNWIASKMTGYPIKDLTSGLRAVSRDKFIKFLYLLPNGFSYPTTITMAFFRAGYSVCYMDIEAEKRIGKSHINLMKDGIRFLIIIFKIGTLYSPLKIFLPITSVFFVMGLLYYLYTFFTNHSFTNMGMLLFISAILIFLIGLVSEQITALIYKDSD